MSLLRFIRAHYLSWSRIYSSSPSLLHQPGSRCFCCTGEPQEEVPGLDVTISSVISFHVSSGRNPHGDEALSDRGFPGAGAGEQHSSLLPKRWPWPLCFPLLFVGLSKFSSLFIEARFPPHVYAWANIYLLQHDCEVTVVANVSITYFDCLFPSDNALPFFEQLLSLVWCCLMIMSNC